MFELNGEQYSLEQVQEAAKQSNLSLDDYIAEYNITKLDNEGKTIVTGKHNFNYF